MKRRSLTDGLGPTFSASFCAMSPNGKGIVLHQRERRSDLTSYSKTPRSFGQCVLQSHRPSQKLMTEFFVIMQKRNDGKVYADLHKSIDRIYLTELDAREAFQSQVNWDLRKSFHIVRLFACTEEETAEINKVFGTVLELSKS